MVDTHEANAVVDVTGSIHLSNLPFPTGERVRIVVRRETTSGLPAHGADDVAASRSIRHELKGSVLRYDRPDEPVGLEDWSLLPKDTQS